MATKEQLKDLTGLRLAEAEALLAAGLYDGCVYLCGYVVELALKAKICTTLGIAIYPDKRQPFKTHDFDELKLFAGMEQEISAANPELLKNWSIATEWRPDWRYQPRGTYSRGDAERVLEAIKADPDGFLPYISKRW
jgi:HEPN domain-containing protein